VDRLIAAALATQHEFGRVDASAAELIDPPRLDAATLRAVQHRRFRSQAQRACRQTAYYSTLFGQLGIQPARLEYEAIAQLPVTPRAAVRSDPAAFVCRDSSAVLTVRTSGTTGGATSIAFSARELDTFSALAALGFVLSNDLRPDDVVYLCSSPRSIGALVLLRAVARVGALALPGGSFDPHATLARLAEPLRLPNKKARPSVLQADASCLGELVATGLRCGYRPRDFGLERIFTGGETVTAGLRARLPELFGEVGVLETYEPHPDVWTNG
jgi:phenylacetate-coenzyme A ligase PaaK-like adenylate-forming protein